jgi:NADH-quinone oxidoreductase subunit H
VATIRVVVGAESALLTPAMVIAGLVAVALIVVVHSARSHSARSHSARSHSARSHSGRATPVRGDSPPASPTHGTHVDPSSFDPTAGGFPVPPLPHQRAALDASPPADTAQSQEARHA